MPVEHNPTLQGNTTRLHPNDMDQEMFASDAGPNDAEYICCNLEFDNEIDHLTHMINHTAEKIILLNRVHCDHCNFSCTDYNELKTHLKRHFGFHCYYCRKYIPSWWELVQHVLDVHNYKIKNNKSKRKAADGNIKNKERFQRKFETEIKKKHSVPVKTKGRNNTGFISTIKPEPYVKSEPNYCANVKSEPVFNSSMIKTEPRFNSSTIKTEPPFVYF